MKDKVAVLGDMGSSKQCVGVEAVQCIADNITGWDLGLIIGVAAAYINNDSVRGVPGMSIKHLCGLLGLSVL